jgi:stage IV sporulation protein FB
MSGNIILMLIAAFFFFAASAGSGAVRMDAAARELSAADVMITEFETLPFEASLDDAVHALIRTTQAEFPVVDVSGRLRGMLTRKKIASGLREQGRDASTTEYLETDVPTVSAAHALDGRVSQALQRVSAVAVVDQSERLVGYITLQNLLENMMLAEASRGPSSVAVNRTTAQRR